MPLERVPDSFNDATHEKLDAAVNKDVAESEDLHDSSLTTSCHYAKLLYYIICNSNGTLGPQYCPLSEIKNIIRTHAELQDMLSSAWERKSYREIRNLAILKFPSRPKLPNATNRELHHDLSESFKVEYHGAATENFYEYLTRNETLYRWHCMAYYAKFCSVVQSSGTGKSRLFVELSKKDVVVLYMNLREVSDVDSFPPRDQIPASLLCTFPKWEVVYQTKCYAFFIALLESLNEQLSTPSNATTLAKETLMSWVQDMCDLSPVPQTTARADFFGKLLKKYHKIYTDYDEMSKEEGDKTFLSSEKVDAEVQYDDFALGVEQVIANMPEIYISESELFSRLSIACRRVSNKLYQIFGKDSERPKLVIALDDAHLLTQIESWGAEQYRPADVIARIISDYSHESVGRFDYPIWVVFASTTSKVADFSPPNHKYSSSRVFNTGGLLFPPYTQLGWDQGTLPLGQVDIDDISTFRHLSGFGRPLWQSVRLHQTAWEVLNLAESKLCGNQPFNPQNVRQVLAVLGQRFGLNVTMGHPDSIGYLETGVASDLRVCLSMTLNRTWRSTSYPSEPFLSHVAARTLHRNLVGALTALYKVVSNGMIDVGQRGELTSRLLWLLSKDLYVRSCRIQGSTGPDDMRGWAGHSLDCRMIRVVDWLEFIFGPKIWHGNQGSLAHDTFQDAYLNFSHWICMDADLAGSKDGDGIEINEWTLRHFQRTCAVQCYHQQRLIDKVIPIYFKGGPDGAGVSHIFISDKTRDSKNPKDTLNHITRRNKSLPGDDTDSRPYIAILADLSQPSSFSVTFPERETDDGCLRIYAGGIDEETYPFLAGYPDLMSVFRDFVHLQQISETQLPYKRYLDAQVKYGSTTAEHMHWEHGKTCPDLQGPAV